MRAELPPEIVQQLQQEHASQVRTCASRTRDAGGGEADLVVPMVAMQLVLVRMVLWYRLDAEE